MSSKQECPICRKSANEGQIRPMVALEEAVESWKTARYVTDCFDPSGSAAADLVRRALVLMLATADGDSSRSSPEERLTTVAGPSTPSKRRKLAPKDGED